jgi:amino acid adenylation domain-containing protein
MRSIAQQLFDIPHEWHDRVLYRTGKGSLTYAEVRAQMLLAAAWLQQLHGVSAGQRVAICLPKSLETVCLFYGVLAAGACFVPLQFNGPPDRLRQQLARLEPQLLVTTRMMAQKFQKQSGTAPLPPTVSIEMTDDGHGLDRLLHGISPLSQPTPVDPGDLAAIYFTSGSTGEPKGIMVSFGGMAGTVKALAVVDMTGDDRMINLTPLQYASSMQLFYPLAGGCSIRIMTDEEAMFPDAIAAVLRQERITLWEGTATVLRLLVESDAGKGAEFDAIRRVKFVGERLPMTTLQKAMRTMPKAEFENAYGASEAFRILVYPVPRPLPDDLQMLPLGRPAAAYELTLRNAAGAPVPDGEVGEICVVGDNVMMGYWKEPELTAASRIPGIAKSYRTGDLARLGEDGYYHFVGRADHRIKLRGHRFDLGEIEAALKSHPAVRDAVAIVLQAGPQKDRIFAAVLAAKSDKLGPELKALCAKRLPAFARPAGILRLDTFPQLPSGKVDRKALQALGVKLKPSKAPSRG